MQYISLLRGINVGGNNIIKMAELRPCFEELGFENVSTYIQTGNVLFSTKRTSAAKLTTAIAPILEQKFNYTLPILTLTKTQFNTVVEEAPAGFGEDDSVRSDVIFLIPPLTAKHALAAIPLREGVDTVAGGSRALYFTRKKGQESKSKLSKLVQLRIYKNVTIRNWNTTSKLWSKLHS